MKILAALLVLLVFGLIGGGAFLLLSNPDFLAEEPPAESSSASKSTAQAAIDVKKQAADFTEIQELLEYEILQNPDTAAWLKIEGTDINNSVLQSFDNVDYLRKNERRQYDVYGCYFADYECSIGKRDVLSQNTIIYGHNDVTDDPDGRRFAQLYKFLDPEFAAATPCIQFCTMDDPMLWQVFAVFYTHTYFNYTDVNITDEEKMAIVNTALEHSIYDYNVPVEATDKLLTLSTCTTLFGDDNHRFVVMAKLLPDEEMPETPLDLVERPENRYQE